MSMAMQALIIVAVLLLTFVALFLYFSEVRKAPQDDGGLAVLQSMRHPAPVSALQASYGIWALAEDGR